MFHVVPHWRARPKIVAPSKRNCRIAHRIARTLGSALRGVHRTVLLDERHDLSGAFSAQPASYCATGSAQEPRPEARRSPPPPRARDLEQFSPQLGQPAQRSQDSLSSTRPHSRRATEIRWKPSKSTSRSHRSQRSSDTEQQQVGRDTARGPEDSGGRSPLIIKDLDLYPQSPANTPSPTLNSEEPGKRAKQRHESSLRSEGIDVPIAGC